MMGLLELGISDDVEGHPNDAPVDNDLSVDVPGKLREQAAKEKADGQFKRAKQLETEAKRVEAKRATQQKLTPGQKAVISRLRQREAMRADSILPLVGLVAIGGIIVVITRKAGK